LQTFYKNFWRKLFPTEQMLWIYKLVDKQQESAENNTPHVDS